MQRNQKNIEVEMFKIQRSTRTLFNLFSPVHNWCRQKSKWYYNWHLNPIQPAVHVGVLFLSFAVAFLVCSNFLYAGASPSSQATDTSQAKKSKNVLDANVKAYIQQAAETSAKIVSQEVSGRLGKTDKTLSKISGQITANLTSEPVQEEINNQITEDLATEETLAQLSENIGQIPESSVVDQLSQILAKTSSEATLGELRTEINSNLNLTSDLLASVNSRLGDIVDPESGSANDLLKKIKNKLSNELAVSITNWAASFKVENMPNDFPDPNVSRAQEEIGKEQFNRDESFKDWASRKGYTQVSYSGIVANPTSGTSDLNSLTAPSGHTLYITGCLYSTKNNTSTLINTIQASRKGTIESFVLATGSQLRENQILVKLKTGDELKWQIAGDKESIGGSALTVYYIDLPWEE